MKTIDSLEASIHALLQAGRRFKKERDLAVTDAGLARQKLREAHAEMEALKGRLKDTGTAGQTDRDHEIDEIKAIIESILSRLDSLLT